MNKIVFHYMLANTLFRQTEGREEASGGNRNASPLRKATPPIRVLLGWILVLALSVALFYLSAA